MAKTHYFHSDFHLDLKMKYRKLSEFLGNTELISITEKFVFTEPFYSSPTNKCLPCHKEQLYKIQNNKELLINVIL